MEKMHPSFPDWYRAAKILPDGDVVTKRWAAIDNFEPTTATLLDLVRLFFQVGKPDDTFLTEFRESFQKKDPAFPAKGNDVEMQVLAGAELVDCWSSYPAIWASYTALAVVCTSCGALRDPKVSEILEMAVQKFGGQCADRFQKSKSTKPADFGTAVQTSLKTHCEQSSVPNLAAPLTSMMQEVVRLRKLIQDQEEKLTLQAEETEILWWMFGEHGRDEEKHFSKLTPEAACITMGKDLAGLVQVTPGPFAARAFLDRVLRSASAKPDAPIRIKDAVHAITPEQREQWLSATRWDDALLDFCPIHQALRLSLSSPKKDAWLHAFVQSSGLKKDAALPARDLAYQVYLEGLLHLTWKAIGEDE